MEETRFHQELDQLKMNVLRMAALTERALLKGTKALLERNSDLAQEVIDKDIEVNSLELEVDRLSLRLLALDQPKARDLRFVIGCMNISVDLERIADQAVNVAQRALYLNQRPALPYLPLFEQLYEVALQMFKMSISAFVDQSPSKALETCRMDDQADELNARILRHFLNYMVKEARTVERAVNLIITSRCLERVADHATNIAESVIFVVEGVNVKHQCQHQ
jgi:phosphate transport system protein